WSIDEHDIRGFKVTMNYVCAVSRVERSRDLSEDVGGASDAQRARGAELRRKCIPLQPFHRNVPDVIRGMTCIINSGNVLMIKLSSHLGFTFKQCDHLPITQHDVGLKYLEGYTTANPGLARAVNSSHSSNANQRINLIFIE